MARILITRPIEAALRTASRIEALGHQALIAPVLEIRQDVPARLYQTPPDEIVLTSTAAVEAIRVHPDLNDLIGLRTWAVGARTAAAAQGLGFNVEPPAADLEGLIADLHHANLGPRLLHIAGADRAGDLRTALEDLGTQVEITVVYRAAIADALPDAARCHLASREIAAVLHFSPRSADAFFDLAERAGVSVQAGETAHLCISNTVADRVRTRGANNVHAAKAPQEDAVIDLIALHVR